MHVHPDIAARRSNPAPQRQAQAALDRALDRWRARASLPALEHELHRFGGGEPLAKLERLTALMTSGDRAAHQLAGSLIGALSAELDRNPLAQVSLRSHSDSSAASLVIASAGPAVLVLQVVDGAALRRGTKPRTASFTARETWEHVLAGSGEGTLVRIAAARPGGAELDRSVCRFEPGTVSFRDGARDCLHLSQVAGNLVMLKLQRRLQAGALVREYRLEDGTLVHQAAGSSRESRLELAASLLGRMGRKDAAPLLAAMAEEQGGQSLRWQALRECLGLDTALGFEALCRIAARADDPLAAPAGALRGQLLETYPQLKELAECRA